MNKLYYGDCLDVLRDSIPDESVDLIYLDPPFNSKQSYNVLYNTPDGHKSDAQIEAFEDTWHWGEQAELEFHSILKQDNTQVTEVLIAFREFLHENDIIAYITMMTNRLIEIRRVLKESGSVYLHCDPTASHYLKIIMDALFGHKNFQSEIIWKRAGSHNLSKGWDSTHDIILFYCKNTDLFIWNQLYEPYSDEYLKRFRRKDPDGRRWQDVALTGGGAADSDAPSKQSWRGFKPPPGRNWSAPRLITDHLGLPRDMNVLEKLEAMNEAGCVYWPSNNGLPRYKQYLDLLPGVPVGDVWTDISPINSQARERLGYPTQKPVALLDRIIKSSTKVGDVVLDPFCGCGTAVHSAQRLGRKWIGIDITHLAISHIEKRLRDAFPNIIFDVYGTPKSMNGAIDLAERDKYQFQWWACSLVNAQPYQGKKKGADTGIDGVIYFQDEKGKAKKIIVSIKGGKNVHRSMIADLKNTVERENAHIGIFITLTPPTKPMIKEACSAGFYESPTFREMKYPKIQILTIDGLLSGSEYPVYPDLSMGAWTFKKAKRENLSVAENRGDLFSKED